MAIYAKERKITVHKQIPDTTAIPLDNQVHWLRIPDVICVYVDMLASTRLSAVKYDTSTAGAYQLFTGTAVRLLAAFEPPYIDVRGDGAFALFNVPPSKECEKECAALSMFPSRVPPSLFVPFCNLRPITDLAPKELNIDEN